MSNLTKSKLFLHARYLSTQVTCTHFSNEWKNAKPFESLPSMTKFQTVKSFMPGGKPSVLKRRITDDHMMVISGKYYKLSLIDLHKYLIHFM
jgi:hypothetical protein